MAARWCGNEARRVYAVLKETEAQRAMRHNLELLHNKGGSVSVREWQRLKRKTSKESEVELNQFVQAKLGRWESPKPGPTWGPAKKGLQTL